MRLLRLACLFVVLAVLARQAGSEVRGRGHARRAGQGRQQGPRERGKGCGEVGMEEGTARMQQGSTIKGLVVGGCNLYFLGMGSIRICLGWA